jgi:8-amino-7-oxononanoate synthase
MSGFIDELQGRLDAIERDGLSRRLSCVESPQSPHLTMGGRSFLNFSSNDYLGLATHPALKEAATRATKKFGAGAGASRLICGSLAPHRELEEALADFKGTEASLSFSSGYAAALGAITALIGRDDVVILDKLVHASIVDAARLSGATLRVFLHNDMGDLEKKLLWARRRVSVKAPRRILIVTESVFSMDGDLAPLRDIADLKEAHGAWLMVDEAHATGLFGERRRGLAEEFGVAGRVEVQMGTLGKACGAAGGYICGERLLVDLLVNRARSFIFSTAPVPAAAAAATAGIRLIQSDEGAVLRRQLWTVVERLKKDLIAAAWPLPAVRSAILPLLIGKEEKAAALAAALRAHGVFVPAIRYPTVARGKARLRLAATAAHTVGDVETLVSSLSVARTAG